MDSGVPKQATTELQRGVLVAALLHQDIQDFARVIDRPLEMHPPAADPDDRFVQMPSTFIIGGVIKLSDTPATASDAPPCQSAPCPQPMPKRFDGNRSLCSAS